MAVPEAEAGYLPGNAVEDFVSNCPLPQVKGVALLGTLGKSIISKLFTNNAFKIAQEGGRHAGQLKQFLKQDAAQLGRSIRKFDKNIAKHEKWISA